VISGFRREVAENCAVLRYYASSGNFLPTFRDKLSVPFSGFNKAKKPEDGPDLLSRNVGKKLPLLVA
jgi:hypothetical protein